MNTVFGLIVVSLFTLSKANQCPAEKIGKCVCAHNTFSCIGPDVAQEDLKNDFTRLCSNLTDPRFSQIIIAQTLIKELGEDQFGDCSFEFIQIENNMDLAKIHPSAFKASSNQTKYLYMNFNSLGQDSDALFKAIRQFKRVKQIGLWGNNLDKLPYNAFGGLGELDYLQIGMEENFTVEDKVFYHSDFLDTLNFYRINKLTLSDNVFAFDDHAFWNIKLTIKLDEIGNFETLFNEHTLDNLNRETEISTNQNLTYLDQMIFKRYFDSRPTHSVHLYGNGLDCQDCRNEWLLDHPEYFEVQLGSLFKRIQITPLHNHTITQCDDGTLLNDSNNFKTCS